MGEINELGDHKVVTGLIKEDVMGLSHWGIYGLSNWGTKKS